MSLTVSNVANPLGTLLVTDTEANGTAEKDTTTGGGTKYSIQIDNTLNTSGVYVKVADSIMNGVTSAAITPDWVYYAPAGGTVTYACPGGSAYSTGLSFWCTTVKSNGSGNSNVTQTDPTNKVVVRILAT